MGPPRTSRRRPRRPSSSSSSSLPRCPFLLLLLGCLQLLLSCSSVAVAAFVLTAPRGGLATDASSWSSSSCAADRRGAGATTTRMSAASIMDKDLLVVGMGTLGTYLGQVWKETHGPGAAVYGETSSTTRHAELKALGVEPTVRSERAGVLQDRRGGHKFPHVVFCVPPSKNEDYVAEVQGALALWSGRGGFVFTSSGGVFAEDNGGTVDEAAPVTKNPRMAKILAAEQAVVQAGGTVLRLAGLYTQNRGPHTFWLARGEVNAPEEGIINLVHYEDAARATMAGLLHHHTKDEAERVLLIADNEPLTRKQICAAAVASPAFKGQYQMPVFKVAEDAPKSLGKVYDTRRSRAALAGWTPKYPSFAAFMASLPQAATSSSSSSVSR